LVYERPLIQPLQDLLAALVSAFCGKGRVTAALLGVFLRAASAAIAVGEHAVGLWVGKSCRLDRTFEVDDGVREVTVEIRCPTDS